MNDDARKFVHGTAFYSVFDVRESIPHRLFGRKCQRVGFAEVVATLSPSRSEIIRSLMIRIN